MDKYDWCKLGYSLEELYFEKINRELINKLKKKMADDRSMSSKQRSAEVIPFPTEQMRNQKKAA